jgi:hypothetical protein
MEQKKAGVKCKHCGAWIDNWVVVMSGKCHRCNQPHEINKLIAEANRAKEREQALKAAHPYLFVKKLLLNNMGCLYDSTASRFNATYQYGTLNYNGQVIAYDGEEAWNEFVKINYRKEPYTCLKCSSCSYIHIVHLLGDFNSAGELYNVRVGSGFRSAKNWVASFKCRSCGCMHKEIHISVSGDLSAAHGKKGDPFRSLRRQSNILFQLLSRFGLG